MPAKKSTTAVATAPAVPSAVSPVAFAAQPTGFPQFQFAAQPTGMPAFQFGAPQSNFDVPPQFAAQASQFAAQAPQIPVAQAVAVAPPTPTGPSAIELIEAQMKTMRDYLTNMEKTFKEAKKGMKKPKVPKDPNAPKNPIPEGTQAWNDFVVLIQKEESDRIRATDPTKPADWKGITRKEAMAKAKELKAAGDPRYNYVKKEKPASPTLTATATATAPTPTATAAGAEPKKRGRKPKTAAVALPAPALPPSAVAPFSFPTMTAALPPSSPAAEESIEVEEITINGAAYLMTSKKECWHMLPNGDQGQWAGIYNGSIIVPAPEPSS